MAQSEPLTLPLGTTTVRSLKEWLDNWKASMDDCYAETDRLAELISRRQRYLQLMRELGEQQAALIDAGDMGRLLRVLSAKQRLFMELDGVERALDPYRGQSAEQRLWRSAELRDRCRGQLDDCTRLFAEIVAQERQGENLLIRRRDEAAERLAGAHFAQQAQSAYQPQSTHDIPQLDLASES